MALALEQFVKQLEDSGILNAETLKDFIPPKADPKSAEELARELVQKKKLTKFQAQEAYQGKAKSLVLGNYTILDKIGQGGMGQVFKAEHRRLKRVVAIKMLPPAVTKDKAAVARFQREVEAAAKLRHPNVVATDDADEAKGVHFLVMEYVEGRDLAALVKKDGPFPVDKAVNYVLQAARGLEFAHGEGVIHRDIKPSNLLLDLKGTVKILDMGLARIEAVGDADAQAELTGTGMVMGTVDFMAPEQGMNTKGADARADIYSLGCTLHYLLIGKSVYRGETVMAKMVAHLHDPIPNLCQLRDEVPLHVDAVFQKMVAKKVEDRYQTMSEVVADLERCGLGREASSSGILSFGSETDEGLLTFLKDIPAATTHKPKATRAVKVAGQGGWKNKKPLLIGAGALGVVVLLAGVIFSLKTKDGTLVVEVNQPDAIVQVLDGEGNVEISQLGGREPVSISVVPGKHRIRVEKDGFVTIADDIEIELGGKLAITARLVPKAKQVAGPAKSWETPAFQQWVKATQALPAEQQIEAVSKKLMELNPGFDGKVTGSGGKGTPKIEKGVVTDFHFLVDRVADVSPVRALQELRTLNCSSSTGMTSQFSDLSPLEGMQLVFLGCTGTQVSDLSPLQGMPISNLQVVNTQVAELSSLSGMPLKKLLLSGAPVSDLSPLAGQNLTTFSFTPKNVLRGMGVLRGMKSLQSIGIGSRSSDFFPPAEFWKKYDAGEFGKPAATAKLAYLDPAFQQWVKATQALPAEEQIEAVSKKLMELNPGFDGKVTGADGKGTPKVENGVVISFGFITDKVTDISPVRALVEVKSLNCNGKWPHHGRLADLSPLREMALTTLSCGSTQVSDLSPLQGMPMEWLSCYSTNVSSLSPLVGMPLKTLSCSNTPVSDLKPLKGLPLTELVIPGTVVSDLSPLFDSKSLTVLNVTQTKVTPASVAALQKALPNCKIEWDDPAKPKTPEPAAAGTK